MITSAKFTRHAAAALCGASLSLLATAAHGAEEGDYVGTTDVEIAKALEKQGYNVREFETENGLLEVEATLNGQMYEIQIDPETGTIVKIGLDD